MEDCLFCKIIKKEIPKEFSYESEQLVVFPDIHPAADTHILIIPKEHIVGIQDLEDSSGPLLAAVYQMINTLVKENNLENDLYRVVVNGGKAQHVSHLHFHLLGGRWNKMV